jgi:hypothetical protein
MAEITGETPFVVAYQLLLGIAETEKKLIKGGTAAGLFAVADKKWLLDTYAECLQTVQNPNGR